MQHPHHIYSRHYRSLVLLSAIIIACCSARAQQAIMLKRLENAFTAVSADPSLSAAAISVYIADAVTGEPVFERNSRMGMVPASTQKILTAMAAMKVLGYQYRFATEFMHTDPSGASAGQGMLVIKGSGDPSFGSTRFQSTSPDYIKAWLASNLRNAGVSQLPNSIVSLSNHFETTTIPDGWIWQDVGNYFGAGHSVLNWNENRYILSVKPANQQGQPAGILSTTPEMPDIRFRNELLTGDAGSGDQAYIYYAPGSTDISVRGTVPCCTTAFRIMGSVPDPERFALHELQKTFGISGLPQVWKSPPSASGQLKHLFTYFSPSLDSIIHPFLQKSINLYGEALVHAISLKKSGLASYQKGLESIQELFTSLGIPPQAVHLRDGSGLSPLNRVSAEALGKALAFARGETWFLPFYNALPLQEGMHLKSGSMTGVRAFAGYVKSKEGRMYACAAIINNYAGSGSAASQKILRLLAQIK